MAWASSVLVLRHVAVRQSSCELGLLLRHGATGDRRLRVGHLGELRRRNHRVSLMRWNDRNRAVHVRRESPTRCELVLRQLSCRAPCGAGCHE